ncbi:protein FAM180A [Alosa pseudoharengus]|uniref:protein FAM180A n=1 Tax=Alosa pseudoharengus TaxID=34774 RepID=UPI003F8ACD4B
MQAKTPWFVTAWLFLGFGGLRDFRDLAAVRTYILLADASPGYHGGVNPQGFVKSISDANRMYEFLLSGMEMDADNNMAMLDRELASMRQGRAFLALVNDHIPKTLSGLENMAHNLEVQDKPISLSHFETLVLGIVYSAYQARRQQRDVEQRAWTEVLGRLANVTFVDLRRTNAKF